MGIVLVLLYCLCAFCLLMVVWHALASICWSWGILRRLKLQNGAEIVLFNEKGRFAWAYCQQPFSLRFFVLGREFGVEFLEENK